VNEATLSVATEASNNSIKRATIGIALHVGLDFYGDDGPHCIIDPQNRLDFNAKMLEATFNISSEEDKPKVVEFTVGNGGESWLIPHPTQATLQPGNLPTSSQQISLKVDVDALQPRPEPYKTDLIITCTYTNNPGHGPRLFVVPITVTV